MYLAYGSNLHPLRLRERVPSAAVVGVVPLAGRRLAFSKVGADGSGKCTLVTGADRSDRVYGVLYRMDASHKGRLDRAESKGAGYTEEPLSCELGGTSYTAFTYLAQAGYIEAGLKPFSWYLDLVLEGARYHSLPPYYLQMLGRVPAVPDPDAVREARNRALLRSMREPGVAFGASV